MNLTVVMITLNEAHYISDAILQLSDLNCDVVVVDSHSKDRTVEIAESLGARVFLNEFSGFGNQWNFALNECSITTPWVMKIDPDERLNSELRAHIFEVIQTSADSSFWCDRRFYFMGADIGVSDKVLRLWRNGSCKFTETLVNEHPIVSGVTQKLRGALVHLDSPNLEHWLHKQNTYSSLEATKRLQKESIDFGGPILSNPLYRRGLIKKLFNFLPLRFHLMTFYCFFVLGAWKGGKNGWRWSVMRGYVFRLREYKFIEMTNDIKIDGMSKNGI